MSTLHRPDSPTAVDTAPLLRLVGAVLAVAVTVIHVMDQDGIGALKDVAYIGYGYWVLEAAGVLAALGLVAPWPRLHPPSWLLALGVAAGPLIGYALTRGPGLPNAMDDKGNWWEPLGVASLIVEGLLLLLALGALARTRRS